MSSSVLNMATKLLSGSRHRFLLSLLSNLHISVQLSLAVGSPLASKPLEEASGQLAVTGAVAGMDCGSHLG